MADEWYCEIAGREIGPLSSEQLRAMAARGQILPNDCVRQGAQGSWVLARQVKGLLSTAPASSGAAAEEPTSPPQILPLQRRGVSPEPGRSENRVKSKPAALRIVSDEPLPVAQRLPETPAAPQRSPSQPPVAPPPTMADVFDTVALGIVTDEPSATAGLPGGAKVGRSRQQRRLERQMTTVGLLAAAVVGLAVASLLLLLGSGSSEPKQSDSAAPAEEGHSAQANRREPRGSRIAGRRRIARFAQTPTSQDRDRNAETADRRRCPRS